MGPRSLNVLVALQGALTLLVAVLLVVALLGGSSRTRQVSQENQEIIRRVARTSAENQQILRQLQLAQEIGLCVALLPIEERDVEACRELAEGGEA